MFGTMFTTSRILIVWIGAGIIRVLIGSSTSPIAYILFGLFWLVSLALLVAAIRQLLIARRSEQRIEAIAICAVLISVYAQGLLGSGNTIGAAAIVFLLSAIVLLVLYGRRLKRRHPFTHKRELTE